jgi:hypothetical protein
MTTRNSKDNPLVVRATFAVDFHYNLPDGLDLEDERVVKSWGIRWRNLYIYYMDGREIVINPIERLCDYEFKRAQQVDIVSAVDCGIQKGCDGWSSYP